MSNPMQPGHVMTAQAPVTGRWLVPVAAHVDRLRDRLAELNADLSRERRPTRRRRVLLATARIAATFGIGVIATLAWQPYGDAARMMIASSSPQLGWLAPQGVADVAAVVPDQLPPVEATPSALDEVRDRVDRIAASQERITNAVAQLTATQQRIAEEIGKVREVEEYLLYKSSYKSAKAIPLPTPRPATLGPSHKTVVHRPSPSSLAAR